MAGNGDNRLGRLNTEGLSPRLPRRASSRSPLRDASSVDDELDNSNEAGRIPLQDLNSQPQPQPTTNNPTSGSGSVSGSGSEGRIDNGSRGSDSQDARRASAVEHGDLPIRRGSQQRVRFSVEVDPRADARPPSRGNALGLRVDTSAATVQRPPPALAGNPSPEAAPNGQNSPTSPVSPNAAPASPKNRNRGYSLRRTLFTKNIQNQSEVDDGAIELNSGVSSDGKTEPTKSVRNDTIPEKDGDVTVVTTSNSKDASDNSTVLSDPSDNLKKVQPYPTSSSYEKRLKLRATRSLLLKKLKEFNKVFRQYILRIKEVPPSKDGRKIHLNAQRKELLIDERTGKHYISNSIRSSRYSLWSFFPRQLVAQFSKLANFYFLVVAILQMIPGLSTTGTFTTFIPLMIFVGISMGKEGIDDLRRYRLDREENNRIAYVLRPPLEDVVSDPERGDAGSSSSSGKFWIPTKWVDIKVGDVIRLDRDQPAPADLVLLHADDPNGIAYIETMALDGETNLKNKQPCLPVAKTCETPEDVIANESLHFAVEDPNIDLYRFDGNVTVAGEKLPLTNAEVIYRGSVLRNTHEAFGMVIYTGEECKIRMNANKNPRIKAPALQTVVNRVVAVIVVFVVVLAAACTIAYSFWSKDVESESWYLDQANVSYGPIFTSFLIMFNTMIPISLYVSLEIVKVGQMFLMNDIDMYDEESDTPMEARTSTINEELGQVSYIFSDKTGTLTNNTMRFRKMSVAGTAWIHDTDLQEEAAREGNQKKLLHKKRQSKGKKAERKMSRKSNVSSYRDGENAASSVRYGSQRKENKPRRGNRTTEMLEYIKHKPYTVFARKARFFLLALALCHTCIPEHDEDEELVYQAASPDEAALVVAAKELGYVVVDRQPNSLTVKLASTTQDGEPIHETYEVLDVIEFSSARKRMSIVVRMPDGRMCIFTKGADTTIMKLLKRSAFAAEKATEIEDRANKRKSMEVKEVMRRNSEQVHRRESKRGSVSVGGRHSYAATRRSSVSGKRQASLRDSIDVWLREREHDGADRRHDDDAYYSPRPSAQFGGGRQSNALSEGRLSFQTDDDGEDLVEESLVVNENAVFERCFQHLNDFATEGLRTLLYGYRFIDEGEYREWKQKFHEATTSLVDRQEKIEKVGEELETQFELIGATAIEDKLQKGVPETIDKLRRASIKLWMLTGDKRETAINIGHSCRLVKDYSTVTILDHTLSDIRQTISTAARDIKQGNVVHSVVVIDGLTLSVIESDVVLVELFMDLAILAESVICCRASPKQKAFLVKSIRKRVNRSITLAIGDGANDIAMIQEAHVGIGITGKEGLQAARISDYSIAQFRFLLKLLLVHGRWNYVRVCKYTLGTFWKETLFYLTQALYQRWNGYTGTSLYEQWSLSMFNTLFTSLPVIFLGIFEKDLSASTLLAVPELYTKGQQHAGFNIKLYLAWAFMGVCEAMVVYFSMFGLFGQSEFPIDNGLFAMGFLCFSACVVIINTKLQVLEIHNKSVMALVAFIVSVGGWWLWNVILSRRYKEDLTYNVRDNFLPRTGQNLLWWTTLLLAIAGVVLFEIAVSTIRATVFPTDVDVFQEYEKDIDIKKRFEEAAASELQQGWNRGTKKSSFEIAREAHVQELIDRRSGGNDDDDDNDDEELAVEDGGGDGGAGHDKQRRRLTQQQQQQRRGSKDAASSVMTHEVDYAGSDSRRQSGVGMSSGNPRRSIDIHELFSKGFGSIRKGPELK